jgi:phospholipid/cholesterol/gamma-HCH transport system ATP-binding protein
MPASDAPEILAVEKAHLAARPGVPAQWTTNLHLSAGELAFVEVSDNVRSGYLLDLCLGLEAPVAGVVRFRGTDWQSLSPAAALRVREQVGLVLWQGNWLPHQPVMDSIMLPLLHHASLSPDAAIVEAARLARQFGLPGLPADRPGDLSELTLRRAACIKAFVGRPQLAIVEDPALAATPALQAPLIAELLKVLNRGGAAIVCVSSLTATPICGMLGTCGWLRLGDRGLGPARRPHERLVGMAPLHQ